MFNGILPSKSHMCFLRTKPFQNQRTGLCAIFHSRSLLPPPLFSEEVILEAVIVNLQRCRWNYLEQLSPAINENVVRRVILQCHQSPQLALYFFQWSEQNIQQRKFSPLCLDTFSALIHVLIAAKLYDESIDLMKKLMQKDGISPLDLLSSLRHVYVHIWCSFSVYDAVVRACTQLGAVDNAYLVIKALRGNAVMVSIHAWNNFLNSVLMLGQEVDEFWMMYQEMLAFGYVENVNTFNLAILALCRKFKLLEAFSVLSLMIKRNIAPNVVTLNILLDGCCRKVDVALSLEVIMKFPNLFEDRIEPNCITYNTVINGLCKAGETAMAERILREDMCKWGITPNLRTFSILMDGFSRQRKKDEALRLFVEILDKDLVPNTTVYNSLMNCFLKQGCVKYAWYLLSSMMDTHVLPDHFTYSILVEGCLRNGFIKEAFQIHQKLRENTLLCSRDVVSYNILINYFCKHGKIKEAKQILASMITCDLVPDVVTYTTLMDGCCKLSSVDDALHFYDGMIKYEQRPNVITYNTVITGLCKEHSVEVARFIMDELIETGLHVDALTYNTLVNTYCSMGNFGEAISLCLQMRRLKVMENVATYNVLISFLCKSGFFQLAKDLLKAMVDRGIRPDQITYTTLISSFSKCCSTCEVIELHDFLVLRGVIPDDYTYNYIVRPLIEKGIAHSHSL